MCLPHGGPQGLPGWHSIRSPHPTHPASAPPGAARRDLKTENILLMGDRSSPDAKICDFGLHKLVGGCSRV